MHGACRGQKSSLNHIPYTKVAHDEETELEEDHTREHPVSEKKNLFRLNTVWHIVITILVAIVSSFITSEFVSKRLSRHACIVGNERIFDDAPIVYEYQRFKRAGFHDARHKDLTVYEGPPNRKNDAAWERLVELGVVAISREESSRLVNGTATAPRSSRDYIVELEVFHQLHCLKWLRDRLWEFEEVNTTNKSAETIVQGMEHSDHCIDYLRQAIMCHGDMTPITFEWNDEINSYLAHHSTEHQCRNFQRIFEWAKRRATTGLVADGAHRNVELKTPEKFD